jgi:hypothetical protein
MQYLHSTVPPQSAVTHFLLPTAACKMEMVSREWYSRKGKVLLSHPLLSNLQVGASF